MLAGFTFRTPRDLRLQAALQQLRLDALLLIRRQFAQRRRHLAVRHFLGRRERHLRPERAVHLGAQDVNDLGGAIHAFGTDGERERIFAHRGVELDPQARAAGARILCQVDARHFLAVHIRAHVLGQPPHQGVPTLVGARIGLRRGCGLLLHRLGGLCGLGRLSGRTGGHVGPTGLRGLGCVSRLQCLVRLGGLLRRGPRLRRLLLLGLRLIGDEPAVRRRLGGVVGNRLGGRVDRRIAGLASSEQFRREQFKPHARRNRAGHMHECVVHRFGHGRERRQAQRLGLPVQLFEVFGCGVIAQHTFGLVAAKCEHEQVACARQQVLHKAARVEATDDHLLDHVVQFRAVVVDDRVNRRADEHVGRKTEQRHGGVIRDLAVHGAHHELVEHRKRVAHRAAACTHRQAQHAGLGLDLLLFADLLEVRPHHLGRHQTERIMVRARADRADHLFGLGRGEDEHHMLRRLLHDLEQRIEPLLGHHMRLVEDEDLVAVARRREPRAFTQFARVVHTVVARGVDLHDVDRAGAAGRQVPAAFADAARLRRGAFGAVDATRQDARRARLAAAARAREQICVRELVFVERAHERHGHLILPDNARERVWTVPTI